MSLTATVRALVNARATPEMILAVVEAHEATQANALAVRRDNDARRQREKRERDAHHVMSRDVTVTVDDAVTDEAVLSLPLPPQTPPSPTHTPEGITTHERETMPTGPDPPIPKSKRGKRLPDDWEPAEADVAAARKAGLTDEEIELEALQFRNYWTARTGAGATKLSWHRTWQNRCLEVADRKRRNGPRLVAATGQPRGGGRGPVSFADIYARRHGYTSD